MFQPACPPRVTLYVCGVTVYDYSHLGIVLRLTREIICSIRSR